MQNRLSPDMCTWCKIHNILNVLNVVRGKCPKTMKGKFDNGCFNRITIRSYVHPKFSPCLALVLIARMDVKLSSNAPCKNLHRRATVRKNNWNAFRLSPLNPQYSDPVDIHPMTAGLAAASAAAGAIFTQSFS